MTHDDENCQKYLLTRILVEEDHLLRGGHSFFESKFQANLGDFAVEFQDVLVKYSKN